MSKSVPIKNIKVGGLQIKPPSGSAFAYETSPMVPKLHQNCLIVGPRGSGKTTACVNLIEMLPFDRLFIISPTMHSNKELMQRLKIDQDDVYENIDDISCLDKIKEKVEIEAKELDQYQKNLKRYNTLMKHINSDSPVYRIPDDLLAAFFQNGEFEKPTHKWNGRKPCMGLIIDDALGSAIYTKGARKLNNLCILHRHLGQLENGGALGLSLFFLTQSYKCQVGGISRTIRGNATSLILFKIKCIKQLEEIAEEVSGEVSADTFKQIYANCFDDHDKHTFLMIDLHPKPNHPSQFRRNFDEFIVAPEESISEAIFGKKKASASTASGTQSYAAKQ